MRKEAATARLFLFLILFSVVAALLVSVFVGPGARKATITPRTWPYVSLGLLCFFSCGGLSVFMRKHALSMKQVLNQEFWGRNTRQIAVVCMVVVYIFSMEYLGYLISSFIMLTSLFYFFGARQHVFNILTSAGFVAGTYFLFVEVFRISLPTPAFI